VAYTILFFSSMNALCFVLYQKISNLACSGRVSWSSKPVFPWGASWWSFSRGV